MTLYEISFIYAALINYNKQKGQEIFKKLLSFLLLALNETDSYFIKSLLVQIVERNHKETSKIIFNLQL